MLGKRLTILIGDGDRWQRTPLYLAILARLREQGFLGATVTRGIAGFGGRAEIKVAAVETPMELPVAITVIDTAERVERVIPEITAMMTGGVLAVEDCDIRFFAGLWRGGFPDRLVGEVMSTDPEHTTADAQVADVVARLLERDYTALPVVDAERHVVGIIDEADLLERGTTELSLGVQKVIGAPLVSEYLKRVAARGLTVAAAMRPTPTVRAGQPLREAARLMSAHGIKRVPVVDDQGRLCGVLARFDILAALAEGHAHPLAGRSPGLPLNHRTVGDIMERGATVVSQDAGLLEVLERLVGSVAKRVIVVDAERRPIGVIADTDLATRVDPDERPGLLTVLRSRWSDAARLEVQRARAHRAAELMRTPVVTVRESAPVAEALALSVARHIKRLPVVGEDGRLVGIASRPALLAASLDLAAAPDADDSR